MKCIRFHTPSGRSFVVTSSLSPGGFDASLSGVRNAAASTTAQIERRKVEEVNIHSVTNAPDNLQGVNPRIKLGREDSHADAQPLYDHPGGRVTGHGDGNAARRLRLPSAQRHRQLHRHQRPGRRPD